MSAPIQINDVVVFQPRSWEDSRLSADRNRWIYCAGLKPWRGDQVPFVNIVGFTKTPFGNATDVFVSSSIGWSPADMDWYGVPCDPASCAVVVEKDGAYVKLLTLNDDYKPPMPLERAWVSVALLEHGVDLGLVRVIR